MHLLSDLVGPHQRKPILVIGGGPSAKADLERLPQDYFSCVISANEHGFKQNRFKVDFIVSVDWFYGHTQKRMDAALAQYKTPHINRWSWADYRVPEFSFNGDSGLTAVVVAVMLGGHPVVALGLDRWMGDRRYFHETGPEKDWDKRRFPNNSNIQAQVRTAVQFCAPHWVQALSGPMREHWPAQGERGYAPCEAPQCSLKGSYYGVSSQVYLHPTDLVSGGRVLLTKAEAEPQLRLGKITSLP